MKGYFRGFITASALWDIKFLDHCSLCYYMNFTNHFKKKTMRVCTISSADVVNSLVHVRSHNHIPMACVSLIRTVYNASLHSYYFLGALLNPNYCGNSITMINTRELTSLLLTREILIMGRQINFFSLPPFLHIQIKFM